MVKLNSQYRLLLHTIYWLQGSVTAWNQAHRNVVSAWKLPSVMNIASLTESYICAETSVTDIVSCVDGAYLVWQMVHILGLHTIYEHYRDFSFCNGSSRYRPLDTMRIYMVGDGDICGTWESNKCVWHIILPLRGWGSGCVDEWIHFIDRFKLDHPLCQKQWTCL